MGATRLVAVMFQNMLTFLDFFRKTCSFAESRCWICGFIGMLPLLWCRGIYKLGITDHLHALSLYGCYTSSSGYVPKYAYIYGFFVAREGAWRPIKILTTRDKHHLHCKTTSPVSRRHCRMHQKCVYRDIRMMTKKNGLVPCGLWWWPRACGCVCVCHRGCRSSWCLRSGWRGAKFSMRSRSRSRRRDVCMIRLIEIREPASRVRNRFEWSVESVESWSNDRTVP